MTDSAYILDSRAVASIVRETKLEVKATPGVQAAALGVLQGELAQAAVRRAFDGRRLSKRHDIWPMLVAWKQARHSREADVRAKAVDKLHERVREAAGKGFGPIPPPFERPEQFERWLADTALAHKIDVLTVNQYIARPILTASFLSRRRANKMQGGIVKREPPGRVRNLATGGRPPGAERDHRTEKLLAVFFHLFGVEPRASIAEVRQRRQRRREKDDEWFDGAAVRFVAAFEAEIAAAIEDRALADPTRKAGRPCTWKPHSLSEVFDHLYNGEDGLLDRRPLGWKEWTFAVNADGSPAPVLVRPRARLPISARSQK